MNLIILLFVIFCKRHLNDEKSRTKEILRILRGLRLIYFLRKKVVDKGSSILLWFPLYKWHIYFHRNNFASAFYCLRYRIKKASQIRILKIMYRGHLTNIMIKRVDVIKSKKNIIEDGFKRIE